MNRTASLDALPLFGATYDPERDMKRLTAQRRRVAEAMLQLGWCNAETVTSKILRTTGKREKVASIDRQMRYVREWALAEGWDWREREVGGGAKEYRLEAP